MSAIWENSLSYKIVKIHVDAYLRSCFSNITMVGKELIPDDGLIIYAPNHSNALIDALLILQANKNATAFGARADIFRKPSTAKILRWLKIVPIARERDGLHAVASNMGIFDEVVECLKHGTPFCLYSEGTHRSKHSLLPLKKGIFRIAHMAATSQEKPVYIVPVGIDYGSYYEMKYPCKLSFGEAITVTPESEASDVMHTLHERLCGLFTYFPDDENYDSNWAQYCKDHKKKYNFLYYFPALILLTLFVICGILSCPIWITSKCIMNKMEDKTWTLTVGFACKFALQTTLIALAAIFGFIFLPWKAAICLVILIAVSHSVFFSILRFYKELLNR